MSISTTSGGSGAAASTASAPSPTSPTTSMSSAAPTRAANPARMSSWSSTTSTRIVIGATPRPRAVRHRPPAPAGRRAPGTGARPRRRRALPRRPATRSRMPTRPWPPVLATAAGPTAFDTSIVTASGAWARVSSARPSPCLWAFVSASWITRYAVRSTTGASGRGAPWDREVDDEPGGLHVRRAAGRARPARGSETSRGRRPARGAPRRASRSSVSTLALASCTCSSAARAASGRVTSSVSATPACTPITATW